MSNKKILITGASGFIGRHCLPLLLERGFEVHALALEPVDGFENEVVWHCQNLLDNERAGRLIKKIQPRYCLHLAWYTEPGRYWTSAENLPWIAASAWLLYHFRQNSGERFVGAGTCAEYDWNDGHCSEISTPLRPSTLYGACKNAFGNVVSAFSASTSLSSAWGRVFFIYGPHENEARLVPSVINHLLRSELAACSSGTQIRDFMHVEDVASAFVDLVENRITGALNIASGEPISVREIIFRIADLLNGRDRVRLGALPTSESEPPLLTADIGRLKDELGFSPKYDIGTGLEQTVAWWKASSGH